MATSESIVEQPKVHRYSIVDYDDLTVFQEGVSTKEQDRPFIEDRDVSSESTRAIMPSAVNDVVPLGAKSTTEICESILGVLERYRQPCKSDSDKKTWPAKAVFSIQVEKFVLKSEPVRMVLPAFPFKSPNKKIKVLGRLPDKGEEVALALMEGLCRAIEDVYVPGARVDIVSDGLMYNGRLQEVCLLLQEEQVSDKSSRYSWSIRRRGLELRTGISSAFAGYQLPPFGLRSLTRSH